MKFFYFMTLLFLGSSIPISAQQVSSQFVYFDVDDHALNEQSQKVLAELIIQLEQHSDYSIQVIGHTDQDGTMAYNEALAQRRTKAVEDYLTTIGFPTERLAVEWRGERDLLSQENSNSAKQKNRRVELRYQYWDFENVDDLITSVSEEDLIQRYSVDHNAQFFDLEYGTSVYIPAAAFVHADGSAPSGAIDLELIEAFTYTDMVSQNLVTRCKDEILETGGMIYINATADGQALQLKEDKQIELIFPVQKEEAGMELFYGEEVDGAITWNATGETLRTTQVKNDPMMIDFTPIIEYDFGEITKPVLEFEEMPRRPRRMDKPFPPSKNVYSGEKYNKLYANYKQNLETYQNQEPAYQKAERAWQAEVTRRIQAIEDHKRAITQFQYTGKLFGAVKALSRMDKRRAPVELLTNIFSFMKKPFPVKMDQRVTFKSAFGNYTRDIVDERNLEVMQLEHMTTVGRNYFPDLKALVFDAHRLATEEKFARTGQIAKEDFSSYIAGISELGWINCDRFRNSNYTTDVNVVGGDEATKYYMIFKEFRSVLHAKRYENGAAFENIPINSEVKIVSIKLVDNKPHIASTDYFVEADGLVTLNYEPASLSRIREELNSVDPSRQEPEEIQNEASITMFPNPASTDFSLQVDSDIPVEQIAVYDLSGSLVKTIDGSNSDTQTERVSVEDMDSGVYVVNARFADGEMRSERIVVQK